MKRLKKRNSKKKSGATPLLLRSLVTAVTDSADDSSGVGSLVTTRVLKVVFSDDWKSKKNELDKATNYKQYDVWGDMNLYDLDKAMWGDMNLYDLDKAMWGDTNLYDLDKATNMYDVWGDMNLEHFS